jgi:hypothetical protein
MMSQALRSLIPSEDLPYAITAVLVGMFDLSAPSSKLRKPRPRKKCLDRLIMGLDLRPSSRLNGIRPHTIKHQNIKLLGLMDHDTRYPSINGLSKDLHLPITLATPRTNPSNLGGLRR